MNLNCMNVAEMISKQKIENFLFEPSYSHRRPFHIALCFAILGLSSGAGDIAFWPRYDALFPYRYVLQRRLVRVDVVADFSIF